MFKLQGKKVSLLLNKIYVSFIDPDRSREAFKRTDKFSNPVFLKKVSDLKHDVDLLVFKASFMEDIKDIKKFIEKASQDILDILIFRFNLQMLEFENKTEEIIFPFEKPDALVAFRFFLIEDENLRNMTEQIN